MMRIGPRARSPHQVKKTDLPQGHQPERTKTNVHLLRRHVGTVIGSLIFAAFLFMGVTRAFFPALVFKQKNVGASLQPAIESALAVSMRAGQEIVRLRDSVSAAKEGKEPVTIADETSHGILSTMAVGQTLIVSEEGVANGEVKNNKDTDLVVFVDPLDATQEYTEALTKYVSIQICFSVCGRTVAALLHFPFTGHTLMSTPSGKFIQHLNPMETIRTIKDLDAADFIPAGSAHCDCDSERKRLEAAKPIDLTTATGLVRRPKTRSERVRIIVTRSHFRNESRSSTGTLSMRTALAVLQELYPNMVIERAGGAGYKLTAVLNDEADAYIHDGPIRMWDVCAGAAIVKAAGGTVTDWLGDEHRYCLPTSDTTGKKAGFAVRGIVATRDAKLHKDILDVIMGKMGTPA